MKSQLKYQLTKLGTMSSSILVGSILLLQGCGGDGNPDDNQTLVGTLVTSGSSDSPVWNEGVFDSSNSFSALCESPRTGLSQTTGAPFPDLSGSTLLENHWLRSWTNETYLWYREVTDFDPGLYETAPYFDLLKTDAVTESGAPKDQFHFTVPTDEWEALSQSGVSAGYGFQIVFLSSTIPREIAVAYVEPDSPADLAGMARGARIISVDGVSAETGSSESEIDVLNEGLFPSNIGETHNIEIQDLGSSETRFVNLTSSTITSTPVQNVKALDTASGKVGYILFNDHIATAEAQLIDAVEQLSAEPIDDLVLDLRYNGGGFLAIASELAYMIAGPTATNGQIFEQLVFNDKHPVFNPVTGEINDPVPFFDQALGFSTTAGTALPSLNLSRVFVLASSGTCSASESIINSLRGVDIEVILIGNTTCGKPYGFYATDNCGTSYFSIQFQAENAQGFGEYADGFTPQNIGSPGTVSLPGCFAEDDLNNLLGDENEGMLSTALVYRVSGTCVAVGKTVTDALEDSYIGLSTQTLTPKPLWLLNRIMDRPDD